MRFIPFRWLPSGPRAAGRLGAALLASAVVALAAAQLAAADTASYVQSAAALNFPADSPARNSNWFLYDTACGTSHSCEAVGYYTDGSGHEQAYVEQIVDGVPGPATKVALPQDADANPGATLLGVTCASADSCEAYGTYQATINSSTVTQALVVRITDGVPETAVALPRPADAGASTVFPNGISCATAADCAIVGSYETTGGAGLPFVVPVSDGVPQALAVPALPDAAANPRAALDGVACQASGSCVAVGDYDDANGPVSLIVPIADGVVGNGVSTEPADAGSSPSSGLTYVACPSSGACEAAGDYVTSANEAETLVVPIVDGLPGTATGVRSPSAHGNDAEVTVDGLACSSASLCVAGGYYTDSSNHQQAAVIPIGGPNPTAYQTALPSDAATANPYAEFYADSQNTNVVGCATDGSCLAAGNYAASGGILAPSGLVQEVTAGGVVGSGAETLAPADISPTGPFGAGPDAIPYFGTACVDAGSCVTTGEYYDTAGLDEPYLVSLQAPLGVVTAGLTWATQGVAYSATLAAAGAWSSYSWSLASGSLPAGLSLNPQSGVISGTPTAAGSSTFTVRVTGTGAPAQTATRQLSLSVAAAATTTTPAATPPAATAQAPTPAGAAPPVPVLSLSPTSGRLSAGRLAVRLSCAAAACSGTVRIRATQLVTVKHGSRHARRRVTATVASRSYTLAPESSTTLRLALQGSGRRLLSAAKHHRLAVTIVATVTGGRSVMRRETIGTVTRR